MKGTVLYGPHDIRFEERDAPKIIPATDAIILRLYEYGQDRGRRKQFMKQL